jgi:hypothetical protein
MSAFRQGQQRLESLLPILDADASAAVGADAVGLGEALEVLDAGLAESGELEAAGGLGQALQNVGLALAAAAVDQAESASRFVGADELFEGGPLAVPIVEVGRSAHSVTVAESTVAGVTLTSAVDEGIAYVAYFPLGSAFPHMPNVSDNAAVKAIAQRLGASPAQVGLAWLLGHRDNVLLIPGTSSVAHLNETMEVASITLSEDDVAELES